MSVPDTHWWEQQRSAEAERLRREISRTGKRKRVSAVLSSGTFRSRLEDIVGHGPGRIRRDQANLHDPPFELPSRAGHGGRMANTREETAQNGQSTGAVTPVPIYGLIPVHDLDEKAVKHLTAEEIPLRCKMATLCRIMDMNGWTNSLHNTVTGRLTSTELLMNPFGLQYREITAGSLVKVDSSGAIINEGRTRLGISKAGYMLHSAIHAARPEIQCVMHVHTTAGAVVSAMPCGLSPISREALTIGPVAYHSCNGLVLSGEESKALVMKLGRSSKVLILQNSGLIILGKTIEEAFFYASNLIRACEIQVRAMSGGSSISDFLMPDKATQHRVTNELATGGVYQGPCGIEELEFEASVRELEDLGCATGLELKTASLLYAGLERDNPVPRRPVVRKAPEPSSFLNDDSDFASRPQPSNQHPTRHVYYPYSGRSVSSVGTNREYDARHGHQQVTSDRPSRSASIDESEPATGSSSPALTPISLLPNDLELQLRDLGNSVDTTDLTRHKHGVAQSTESAIAALRLCVRSPSTVPETSPATQAIPTTHLIDSNDAIPISAKHPSHLLQGSVALGHRADIPFSETLQKTRKLAKTVAESTRSSATSLVAGYALRPMTATLSE